jgi:hypothetical protein
MTCGVGTLHLVDGCLQLRNDELGLVIALFSERLVRLVALFVRDAQQRAADPEVFDQWSKLRLILL